jgi:hypothetical protein
MDAAQDNFSVTGFLKPPYSLGDYVRAQRPTSSPGAGNDAIGAKGVATILDFHKGAGSVPEAAHRKILKEAGSRKIFYQSHAKSASVVWAGQSRNLVLEGMANDIMHTGDGSEDLGRHLGITACDHQKGAGVAADEPPYRLPGLHGRLSGHCASVDKTKICLASFVRRMPSLVPKLL